MSNDERESMDIVWEAPPRINREARVSDEERELAAALRDNPDQWARMADFTGDEQRKASQLAALIRRGDRAAFKVDDTEHGIFETKSRKIPKTDITAVYVRYVTQITD